MSNLRSKRRGRQANHKAEGKTIELGGFATFLLSVFVVFLGYGLSQVCIVFLRPECALRPSAVTQPASSTTPGTTFAALEPKHEIPVGETAANDAASKSKPEHEIVLGAPAAVKPPKEEEKEEAVPEFPATAKFPPNCTAHEFEVLAQQLAPDRCEQFGQTPWNWKAECPFSKNTYCGNNSPNWMYDFVHESSDPSFRGIIVGCNKGYEAVELLRIVSSSSSTKYDVAKWKEEFAKIPDGQEWEDSESCEISGKASASPIPKQAQIHCIEGAPNTVQQLQTTKQALGYGDELQIHHAVVGDQWNEDGFSVVNNDKIGYLGAGHIHWERTCARYPDRCEYAPSTTIDRFVDAIPALKATSKDDRGLYQAPLIHYMSISAEGSDYEILKGAARNLGRIQYIDFGYHWNWYWGSHTLQDLMHRLKKKGFVCYFTGYEGQDLWRITDCWQEHYSIKFPAQVGCVNANIPEAEPLLTKMEDLFHKTLAKST